jgi:cellulose biosynthesis protein BcsQ
VKVLATYAIKGGVGKTSTAVNLAHLAARDGLRTLLWDLDPQGSATFLLGAQAKVRGGGRALVTGRRDLADVLRHTASDRLDLVPADFSYRSLDLDLDAEKKPTERLRRLLTPLRKRYDLVVLDCPPSVSLVSESVLDAADLLLVPVVPALLAVRSFEQLVDFVGEAPKSRRPEVVGFPSMVDRRKKAHRELLESLPAQHPRVAPVAVPALAAVEQMAEHRAPVVDFAPRSPAVAAYAQLWDLVRGRLSLPPAPTRSPGGGKTTGAGVV